MRTATPPPQHGRRGRARLFGTLAVLCACAIAWMLLGNGVVAPPTPPPGLLRAATAPIDAVVAEAAGTRTAVPMPPPQLREEPARPAQHTGPAAPAQVRTRVEGRVIDDYGFPVGGVPVCARRRATPNSAAQPFGAGQPDAGCLERSDASGRFTFADLAPGHYEVGVDTVTLPRRLVAHATDRVTVEVAAAAIQLQPFVVRRTATVEGRVLTADGTPVELAMVRMLGPGWSQQTPTDVRGCYRLDGLPPGSYRALVVLDAKARRDQLAAASPFAFELLPGECKNLPPLVSGLPGGSVTGIVIDEAARPVADLEVAASTPTTSLPRSPLEPIIGRVRTDKAGRFTFVGLPPTVVGIRVGQPDDSGKAHSARIAGPGPYREVRFSGAQAIDLGSLAVRLAHPYRLRIEVNLAAAAQPTTPGSRRRTAPDHFVLIERDGAQILSRATYGGLMQWSCETPAAPVTVSLRNRRREIVGDVAVIYPVPDVTQTVVLNRY